MNRVVTSIVKIAFLFTMTIIFYIDKMKQNIPITLRYILIGICILFVFLFILGFLTPQTYTNEIYGFSTQAPRGWKIVENYRLSNVTYIVAFLHPYYNARIYISHYYTLLPEGFQAFLLNFKEGLTYEPGYTIVSEGEESINGMDVYRIVFISGDGTVAQVNIVFLHTETQTYMIMFAAPQNIYNKYLSDFENSLLTFKIT